MIKNKNIKYQLYKDLLYHPHQIFGIDLADINLYSERWITGNWIKTARNMISRELSDEPVVRKLQSIAKEHADLIEEIQDDEWWDSTNVDKYSADLSHNPILLYDDYESFEKTEDDEYDIDATEYPDVVDISYVSDYICVLFCMKNFDFRMRITKRYNYDRYAQHISVKIKEFKRFREDERPLLYLDELFKAAGYARYAEDRIYKEKLTYENKIVDVRVLQYRPVNITFVSDIHPAFRLTNKYNSEEDVLEDMKNYIQNIDDTEEVPYKERTESLFPFIKKEHHRISGHSGYMKIDYRNTEGGVYSGKFVKKAIRKLLKVPAKNIKCHYSKDDKRVPCKISVYFYDVKMTNREYQILEYIVNKSGYYILNCWLHTDGDKLKQIIDIFPY